MNLIDERRYIRRRNRIVADIGRDDIGGQADKRAILRAVIHGYQVPAGGCSSKVMRMTNQSRKAQLLYDFSWVRARTGAKNSKNNLMNSVHRLGFTANP
jgi:hypothetical protein